MNLLRLGWRNIWRNGRRTSITVAAAAVSAAVLIWVETLTVGMMEDMLASVTQVTVGEAQVHAPGYLSEHSIYLSIPDPDGVVRAAEKSGVAAVRRSYGFGLVACGEKSAGARFWGVEPGKERDSFDLAAQTGSGEWLGASARRGMVLGKKLARSLNASIGSEIIVVVQSADGSLGNELFEVTGILKTVGTGIDRGAAIIHRDDFRELFVTGAVHEVALNTRGRMPPEAVVAAVAPQAEGMEVKSWGEILPIFAQMADMVDAQMWILGTIFFLAAGLGVMNTMLMATYERMREFGVLKALGTSPLKIVAQVATEAAMLGLVATVFALAIGLAGAWFFQEQGIDLAKWSGDGISFAGVMFDPVLKGRITPRCVFYPIAMMLGMCVLASLYPAIRVARLDPVIAMTHV